MQLTQRTTPGQPLLQSLLKCQSGIFIRLWHLYLYDVWKRCVSWALKEGARGSGPGSAKLKRFAAALKLDDKHHTALVQSAAAHNMEVGNYG